MCYPCTQCGRCGKFDPDSPLYTPMPTLPCMKCGGEVDLQTGVCTVCGEVAFAPVGKKAAHSEETAAVTDETAGE